MSEQLDEEEACCLVVAGYDLTNSLVRSGNASGRRECLRWATAARERANGRR